MNQILELREKRAKAWEAAKAFLDSKRNQDGFVSAEDEMCIRDREYIQSRFMLQTSHYDKEKADRAVMFIQNLCHTKGKWAGKKFLLLSWQEQIVRDIFGIVKDCLLYTSRCV